MIEITPGVGNYLTGIVVAGGAAIYGIWGYLQRGEKAVKFSWKRFAITIIPSIVAGFLAGYEMEFTGTLNIIGLLTSGFGIAAAGKRVFKQ